jgi:hypothetical protein
MHVKCLNGELIEVEMNGIQNIKNSIIDIHPEWNQKYDISLIPDNEDFFLWLEPKLQINVDKEMLNVFCYRYKVKLFYSIEDEEREFHSFDFYKNYSTTDYSKRYPIYGFGTNKYIVSYWGDIKEMIDNIRYRVCTGVYSGEKKEVWDVIVKHMDLFENKNLF